MSPIVFLMVLATAVAPHVILLRGPMLLAEFVFLVVRALEVLFCKDVVALVPGAVKLAIATLSVSLLVLDVIATIVPIFSTLTPLRPSSA